MIARRTPLALILILAALAALAGTAQAAVTKAPGWKVIGATGPTNLPPLQSEVQHLIVGAEGGTFTLSIASPPQTTAAIAYDAAAQAVQEALEALPYVGAGGVTVSGGPGGDAEHPYLLAFSGSLGERDVPEVTANSASLTGANHYLNIATTVPGGPGTGEIGIIPTNVGGEATSGIATMHLGPLPAGVLIAGQPQSREGNWNCTIESAATELSCATSETIAALSPGPTLKVPVEVKSPLATGGTATVRVEGGNASESSEYTFPVVVSNEPVQAGIASFFSEAFDADGLPSTQAGGHPYSQMTALQLKTARSASGTPVPLVPVGDMRNLDVDLPPGFLGDPLVTDRCPQGLVVPQKEYSGGAVAPACYKADYALGTLFPGVKNFGTIQKNGENPFPIYNDVPAGGTAVGFSSKILVVATSLVGSVRTEEDFGVRIASLNTNTLAERVFGVVTALEGFPEAAHGKAFLRNPTDCAEEHREAPVVRMAASSWQNPALHAAPSEALAPVTGCDKLSFGPEFGFQPTDAQGDPSSPGSSGVGAVAHLHIDQSDFTDPNQLATPDLKQSVVTLPAGLTVNPSQAAGLEACTEAQVGYKGEGALPNPTRFNNNPVSCPDGSKLGTVTVHTPVLEEDLTGTIYLAAQEENPFDSLIALYLVIESPRFGLTLKLPGKAELDPDTGQITATFDYVPQQPVEDLTLRFRGGGPRSEFATPEVCGTYSTKGSWEPWSAPESGPPAQTSDPFTVSSDCASSAATRPFHPTFEAGAADPIAGAFSPLVIKVGRNDGEQELRSLDFTLPPGESARLAGVPYCSEADIAAASSRTGREELASPSCPAASRIGTVDAAAGVGSQPFHTAGAVYLAGPYKGAPISAVVITPAVAGPFDLGDVVIRSPLLVDPETAQVTAKSDPIPTILKGIPLKIRSVAITIDRGQFSLNPTNCEAMAVTATLGSSDGATATPVNRFQVGQCDKLGFGPKLKLSLKGKTKRTGHPALRAVLTARPGEANIGRAQVNLPHAEFLDQGNIDKACTKPVLLAGDCPARSVYGHAKAWTPLLEKPLEGPVYLVGGYGYKLPALVAELNGQIRILLVGKVDSGKNRGIRNTFEVVPDAPVSRFELSMKGGKKYGLLENSENLCKASKAKRRAIVRFAGQNGRVDAFKPVVQNQCKRYKKHKKRHAAHGRANRETRAARRRAGWRFAVPRFHRLGW